MSASKAIYTAKRTWLLNEIKKWYTRRSNIQTHMKVIHSELTARLHPVQFDELDREVRWKCEENTKQLYYKKAKKIRKLVDNNINKVINEEDDLDVKDKINFFTRVVNLTDIQMTPEEMRLLEKGHKYAPTNTTMRDYRNLTLDTEIVLSDGDNGYTKIRCSRLIRQDMENMRQQHRGEQNTIREINKKLKDNNLVLTKADKGNAWTIIHSAEYIQKIEDFITDSGAVEIASDPTNRYQKEIKEQIRLCKTFWSENNAYKVINMNPTAPKLYGQVKLHKQGFPIRPVVAYTSAPAYKLCKSFNLRFRELTSFRSEYAIKNSFDLIDKLKNIEVDYKKCRFVSFDVNSLFTSIPIKSLENIVFEHLENNNLDKDVITDMKKLYGMCIKQNYFQHNNKFYSFKDGLPMGSPLSPLLAEIFMNKLEKHIFEKYLNYRDKIKFWTRYVDDIFCIWEGEESEVYEFLNDINNIEDTIKFTIELEEEKTINFLDLRISHCNDTITYEIYRKTTYADNVIPWDSNHPHNIKLASFQALVSRLCSVPLSQEAFQKEYRIIVQIAENNGFKQNMVDKLIKKKEKTTILNKVFPQMKNDDNNKCWFKLPFIGNISYKIKEIISKTLKVNVAFYNKNILKNLLIANNKDKTSKMFRSGVYEIFCDDCDCSYIGQTGRNFAVRFKEHMRSFRLNKQDSSLAKHLNDEGHTCKEENLKVVHVENKGKRLNLLENFEIWRAIKKGKKVLNEYIEPLESSLIKMLIQ